MKRPQIAGELFPDADAIRAALDRQTRAALLRRHGPQTSPGTAGVAPPPADGQDIDRQKIRGIGFGVDLVRAILAGQKTQTRRPMRPQPIAPPPAAACPVARVGELLYVREPWLRLADKTGVRLLYAADESHATTRRFRPAMYMPRAAARLWLGVTDVRAERLQAITPADLAAEGLPPGQSLASVWDGFYSGAGERFADNPWVWMIGFEVRDMTSFPRESALTI